MCFNDSGTTELYTPSLHDARPISFTTYRDGNGEIYVMNADGTGQTRLTTNDAEDWPPERSSELR